MTPDEDKLLSNFSQIYRDVPRFRKMLLVKAVFDTMSNGSRRKCVRDERWLKYCSTIQLLSPAAYAFIRSNAANGAMPGRHSLEKASKEYLADMACPSEGTPRDNPSNDSDKGGTFQLRTQNVRFLRSRPTGFGAVPWARPFVSRLLPPTKVFSLVAARSM